MAILDKIRKKIDKTVPETLNTSVLENFSQISEQKEIQENFILNEETQLKEIRMPKIKELELLKEGVYSVDLEQTLNDMFKVMKNMEAQLDNVLKINASLEQDLKASKEIISELKTDKLKLEDKIFKMEEQIPSKRELQIEIDYQIQERNNAEKTIRELKEKIEKMQSIFTENQHKTLNLDEQKRDLITEINYLESRLNKSYETIKHHESEINTLRGEKLVQSEKIKLLENELNDSIDEKYRLAQELKVSKTAANELHNKLNELTLQAKRSFYKEQQQEPKTNRETI
ncbi:MAG: hypothetical protein HQK76_13015 [Desulfobacterales bacterium]|nr:hypothetical protein [Desulfobacterales bacterium]